MYITEPHGEGGTFTFADGTVCAGSLMLHFIITCCSLNSRWCMVHLSEAGFLLRNLLMDAVIMKDRGGVARWMQLVRLQDA
jgi:hypothetical protein